MRVLYVHSGNLFGGVEALMLTLVQQQALCPEMEPHFALCFQGRFSAELSANGTSYYQLGNARLSRPLSVKRARHNLAGLLKGEGFDLAVVHSAWTQAIFGTVIRSFCLPLVFWVHDVPDGMPWLERWARWSRPPELVLCNSKYTTDRLVRLYSDVQSRLIYCPVAPPAAEYSNDELTSVRALFETPKDATVILQVSRLEPHKGQLAHLEALALLRELPGWVCWQVGGVQKPEEQRYFERIKNTATRLGIEDRIRFLDWQPDVQRLIAASDIYCQPNIYPEPFGITFIEALYARKPVVATSIGGPKEIVDETCGFLVSPGNAPELAAKLRELIESKEMRMAFGQAGFDRARRLCDPKTQLGALYQAFQTVSANGFN